jgi:hypothetical protein
MLIIADTDNLSLKFRLLLGCTGATSLLGDNRIPWISTFRIDDRAYLTSKTCAKLLGNCHEEKA